MVFANLRQFQFSDFHYILPASGGAPSANGGDSGTYAAKVIQVGKLVTDAGPAARCGPAWPPARYPACRG